MNLMKLVSKMEQSLRNDFSAVAFWRSRGRWYAQDFILVDGLLSVEDMPLLDYILQVDKKAVVLYNSEIKHLTLKEIANIIKQEQEEHPC